MDRAELSNAAGEDLWSRTLKQIPTDLGKLAYLAKLWNAETDSYEHHGLASVFGQEGAESAMRKSHQHWLEQWLGQTLARQRADLEGYLQSLPKSKSKTVESWLITKAYMNFLPAQSSLSQRELFQTNMELLLRSFRPSQGDGDSSE